MPQTLLSADDLPLPAPPLALMLISANVSAEAASPPIALAARGLPPLTAATPLLLHGCLLLS